MSLNFDVIARKTYRADGEGEDIEGSESNEIPPADMEFAVGEVEDREEDSEARRSPSYGNLAEERNVWDSSDGH